MTARCGRCWSKSRRILAGVASRASSAGVGRIDGGAKRCMIGILDVLTIIHHARSRLPDPDRPTLDDLDLDSLTTDQLVSLVRSHRKGELYPP